MSTLTATQLQQQYIAYFGRPGDPAGIKYWLSSTSGISSAREFADKIYAQDEYKTSTVGTKSTEAQVNSLYQNLFGREADASGLIYWTGQIEAGILTLSNIAYDLIAAANNPVSGNETQGAADALALANKTAAAEAFTADVEASTSAILAYQPESTSPWTTGSAFNSGKSFIAGITTTAHTDAGVDTGVAAMVTASTTGSSSDAAGETLKFTTSTDALVGDSLANTINGVLQTGGGTGTTIAPGDSVDGKGGIDTVQISVAGLNGANNAAHTLSAVTTDNVEKFVLSNFETGTGDNTVETGLMTGLTTVGLSSSSSTGDTIFTKLPNFVAAEMRNGSGDLTVTYDGVQVVTGTADSQDLTVAAQTAGTFTVADVETVNIKSEVSKNTLTALTADTLKTLNITGDAELVLTTVTGYAGTPADGVAIDATIDASAFTGKFTSNVGNEAATLDVKGGTNDDVIQLGATLTKNDKIDGGAGTDRVEITGASIGSALKFTDRTLTNVETIRVQSTGGTALSVDGDGDALTRYEVLQNGSDNIAATVSNIAAGDTVAFLATTDGEDGAAYTVSLKDASGTSDSLNLEILGTTALGAESVSSTLTVADVETINIKSGSYSTTAMVAADSNVLTSGVFSAAKTLTATGDANFTISGLTAANLTNVDASALAAKFVITAPALGTAAKPFAITGGAKDDTFTMGTTLSAYDTIAGGGDGSTTGDTLTATIASLGDVVTASKLNISDVENINIISSGTNYIDASNITGGSKVKLGTANGSTSTITVTGLPSGLTYLLGDLDSDDEFKGTIDLALADETGTADTIAVETTVTGADNDITATLKLSDGIETLSIKHNDDDTAGANASFTVSDAKVDKIVLTEGVAAEVLALGQLHVNTTTIDASSFIGSLTLTAGTGDTTVTKKTGRTTDAIAFGTGDDTYTVTAGVNIAEDAGAGTDVLNATLSASITEATDNFETVNYGVSPNVQAVVTAANGLGMDDATTFKVTGGDGLSTFTIATIHSPANLTTIDYSGFNGATTSTTFAAAQLASTMTVTGSAGKDTIVASGTSVAVSSMTGVETLTINAAIALTFDASKATGLGQINVDDDNNAETITLNKLEDSTIVQITSGHASSVFVLDQANKAALDNSISVEVGTTTTGTNIDIADVETINLKNETAASSIVLDGLAMATAGKTNKLVVTGDQTLTVTAHHVDTTVIDASGMSTGGSYVMSGRSDATTAMTFTGSIGNDTFIMNNASDVATAGAGTGDTLTITGAGVIGGYSIDLSSTGDQLTSYKGNSNPAIQSGFENVTLSGTTGAYGADVTGSTGVNTIIGSPYVDSITPGLGADAITPGVGNDIIDLTESTSAADTVTLSLAASNGTDTITGFVPGTDKINVELLGSGDMGATAKAVAANGAAINLSDTAAVVFANMGDGVGNAAITDGTSSSQVSAFLALALTEDTGDDHTVVFNEPATNKAYVWSVINANNATWTTADTFTHVATITTTGAVMTTSDIEYTI